MTNFNDISRWVTSLLPLVLFLVLGWFYVIPPNSFPTHDFGNYYFSALFITEGIFNSDIYFPYHFNQTVADLGYANQFLSFAPNTPFLALFFVPFTLLPLAVSKVVFNVISLVLLMVSVKRLSYHLLIGWPYVLFFPIVFFIPMKNNLLFGQVYFLLFFLLSEGFIAYHKNQFAKMAIWWSLAIALKVFPIILIGFLLFKQRFKAVGYLLISIAVLVLISISITGIEPWQFFFSEAMPQFNNGEIAGAFVDNYQSLFMFIKRISVFDSIENPSGMGANINLVLASMFAVKIALVGLAIFITKKVKGSFFSLSFWLLIGLFVSPYGSTYGLIMLGFFYFSIGKLAIPFSTKLVFLFLLVLLTLESLMGEYVFPLNYVRLFVMTSVIATILWIVRSQIPLKLLGGVSLVAGMGYYLFLPASADKTTHYLPFSMPILTYDYQVRDSKLTYFYWNAKGQNSAEQAMNIESASTENVEILNNQVYYLNEQLTFDHSNKRKPMVINENEIVFLSDKNHGIGFYELRKIELKSGQ